MQGELKWHGLEEGLTANIAGWVAHTDVGVDLAVIEVPTEAVATEEAATDEDVLTGDIAMLGVFTSVLFIDRIAYYPVW